MSNRKNALGSGEEENRPPVVIKYPASVPFGRLHLESAVYAIYNWYFFTSRNGYQVPHQVAYSSSSSVPPRQMARRNEKYARLNPGGGYTQALTVSKGFSGAERSAAKQGAGNKGSSGSSRSSTRSGGTMNAFAQHQELIRNYHRYAMGTLVTGCSSV